MLKIPKNAPYIVESGSNANGWYRKWSDGILECWMRYDLPVASNTNTGMYTVTVKDIWTYPIPFVENPTISITTQSSIDFVFCSPYGILRDSKRIWSASFLRNGGITGGYPISVGITARGRWK